jgi:serum/glucocorticoid-regulated kinase 2
MKSSFNSGSDSKRNVNLDSFVTISVIGKGSYAKVLLVRKKDDDQIYAMKILKKKTVEQKKQYSHIFTERNVLIAMNEDPFFVKIHYSFQTEKKLYFILDYCPGGEMFSILQKRHRLTENEARFYAAQLVLAIEMMHKKDVLYRDLKPENVLIDADGYIKITDFGLSKLNVDKSDTKTICGTPEYLAPEVIRKVGYNRPVDWWTLGSFIYEMLVGSPPFYVSNREQLFEKIKFVNPSYPYFVSTSVRRLLEQLLEKNPEKRLGTKEGAIEIKKHPWFAGINWNDFLEKKVPAPLRPHCDKNFGLHNFATEFTDLPPDSIEASNDNQHLKNFTGFTWEKDELSRETKMSLE